MGDWSINNMGNRTLYTQLNVDNEKRNPDKLLELGDSGPFHPLPQFTRNISVEMLPAETWVLLLA